MLFQKLAGYSQGLYGSGGVYDEIAHKMGVQSFICREVSKIWQRNPPPGQEHLVFKTVARFNLNVRPEMYYPRGDGEKSHLLNSQSP